MHVDPVPPDPVSPDPEPPGSRPLALVRPARAGRRTRLWWVSAVSVLLLVVVAGLSVSIGIVWLAPDRVLRGLLDPGMTGADREAAAIIWTLRLPRAAVAVLVGAALAVVGVVMQAIFRNPLADPGVTGVSAGAAVGAVTAITLGASAGAQWGIPAAAFAGAVAVCLLLQLVLATNRDASVHTLILVGVSINAFAGAMIAILIANARDDALARGAMFWLAGDLDLRTWSHVALAVGPVVLGAAFLVSRSHVLDALILGDDVATTSGVNVHRNRLVLLAVASLVTGAAVSVSGIISFVGLVVPHGIRLLLGSKHSMLLPLSIVVGSTFMLLADTVARVAFSPAVVQTGVICAVVGAPLFLILLLRRRSV